MILSQGSLVLILAGVMQNQSAELPAPVAQINADYFEGRWSFAEETCEMPSNWTLLAGGNFISEDLTGTWAWGDGKLDLRLNDLALDEETGEPGGKFQMEGPVEIKSPDQFRMIVEPDVYEMLRCKTGAP
ncbi:hypothetical protein [Parasphingorhabdus halotolerans]|uniref:Uncharacterized protein n=1 Tax=Parasphingorhabdus halotolerans TaxID=2725558 RepID=A0A6H2DKC2_9SPHN|nr:hypothetical protein [Parasphingorhabdus halotolerans]QJB68587.1 hypothetical protein HF685_04205 [Parasphingorhabdus halotolerans]